LRRSLIQDSENYNNVNDECDMEVTTLSDNNEGERLVPKPSESQECNILSKGRMEATICNDIDALVSGAQEQQQDTGNNDSCPISLDAWGK